MRCKQADGIHILWAIYHIFIVVLPCMVNINIGFHVYQCTPPQVSHVVNYRKLSFTTSLHTIADE